MTEPDPTEPVGSSSPEERPPHPPAPRWPLAVGVVAVMALRWAMSLDARFPRVVADEPAYLAMARLLAGGERWDLGLASTYGPAYSVLIAPWFALGLSPDGVYRAAVATNVVLAGLTFLAFAAVGRRILHLDRPAAAGLAAVATSLPGLVATTNLAWSDNLAPLTFAVLVLALARAVDRLDGRSTALLVVVTVGGYAVHGRFLPIAPVVVAALVALAAGRRLPVRTAAAGVVGIVAGLAVVQTASEALYDRLYDPQHVTQGINQADRLLRAQPLVLSTIGQLWTIVVTTGGLAGIGLVALVLGLRTAWRSTPADDPWPRRLADPPVILAAAVPASMAMAFLASVVFMTDRPRADHLVYGRYNELFLGLLVLWGGAALLASRSRWRATLLGLGVAAAGIAAAVVLWRYRRGVLESGFTVYPVLGIAALDHEGPAALPSVTVVGLALLVVLAVAAVAPPPRLRVVAVVAVAAVLCVTGSQRAVDRLDPSAGADIRDAAVMAEVLPPDARLVWVADDRDSPLSASYYRDQLYTPDNPSIRVQGTPWDDGEPYVVAGARRAEPPAAGYRLAWVEARSRLGLWVAPGPRQDALERAGELLPADGLAADPRTDQGVVRYVEGPEVEDGRVRATVEVERPGVGPWPAVAPGGDARGRIRLGVTVSGRRCRCTLLDGRADLGRWIAGSETRLTVPVDLELAVDPDEDLTVTVELLREGIARFGRPATAAPV